ncbi:MAG: hypothetical protein Q8904_10820 [Bacteroidota bacterium]|nr:hypothetical protein [Bacteroidota bacterium]MDP4291494.1 hypothetical protein [Bacteroidota bacterium]
MKKIILFATFFLAFYSFGVCQNEKGPVLKKELAGKYEGEQKKGLANGKGTATGKESYTGDFIKGLPDGQGVYTDSLGNVYKGAFRYGLKEGKGEFIPASSSNEQPKSGYWMDDKYMGKDRVDPYEITNKIGNVSPRIYSTGPGNTIDITAIDPVDNANIAATINMIGRGNPRNDTSYNKYFFDDVSFPIEFDIRYRCRTKLGFNTTGDTPMADNSIHIKINKGGKWSITLKN